MNIGVLRFAVDWGTPRTYRRRYEERIEVPLLLGGSGHFFFLVTPDGAMPPQQLQLAVSISHQNELGYLPWKDLPYFALPVLYAEEELQVSSSDGQHVLRG
jgi:hypothetical protein